VREERKRPELSDEVLCAEYDAVYHYVLSLCRSESDALDITQEAFLRAMKTAHRFEGDSSLYTWLCAIAKNLWLSRYKKQNREVPAAPDETVPDSGIPLEQRLDDRDTALHIHRILHDISEPYKEVFSLRVFGQLPFADIADLFGKTENWARVTHHRARRMICDRMRKEGYYE